MNQVCGPCFRTIPSTQQVRSDRGKPCEEYIGCVFGYHGSVSINKGCLTSLRHTARVGLSFAWAGKPGNYIFFPWID